MNQNAAVTPTHHSGTPMNQTVTAVYHRLPAVDAMRGLVMILMTVDHASYVFNGGRYVTDSTNWYQSGSFIPTIQFLVRWMTHICAPTFVFLAGLVLAVSISRKQALGISEKQIDVDLMIRGLLIMALDPLWMSLGFGGRTVFQVLYAIGGGICCMALLRRLSVQPLLITGIVLMLGCEALVVGLGDGQRPGTINAFLISGGRLENVGYVLYPLFPWLAYMILGWCCGWLLAQQSIERPARWFASAGLVLIALFALVRGLNAYGNMRLYRDDFTLVQWLHVSKYPPSLTFALMTLGLMCLMLALLYKLYTNDKISTVDPLLVFGRTPLLFYLLHVHLLGGSAMLLGIWRAGGLTETFIAAAAVLLVLFPLCRWYAGVKRAHPRSVLRYV